MHESHLKTRKANASLSEDEVRLIRRLGDSGEQTPRELAAFFSVGLETIRRILRRDTWSWLSQEPLSASADKDLEELANESAQRLLETLK